MASSKNNPWSQLICEKYLAKESLCFNDSKRGGSHGWKSLKLGVSVLREGLGCQIGRGDSVDFWFDRWTSEKSLSSFLPQSTRQVTYSGLRHVKVRDVLDPDKFPCSIGDSILKFQEIFII